MSDVSIRVPIKELMLIQRLRKEWKAQYDLSPNTQFNRVVAVAVGAGWKTLRQLEAEIKWQFPSDPDTQAAISARLREVSPSRCGLVKEKQHISNGKKLVYFYRLVPVAFYTHRLSQMEVAE